MPTSHMIDKERAAFEAWWKGDLVDWRGHQSVPAGHAWSAWQARAAMAVQEEQKPVPGPQGCGTDGVPERETADNWQQYAKEGETAQACIERHRREQDSLLKLLAQAREPLTDQQIIALLPAGWTGMLARVMEFARRIERARTAGVPVPQADSDEQSIEPLPQRLAARQGMPIERIAMLWNSLPLETDAQSVIAFARAIERFHGIGTHGVPVAEPRCPRCGLPQAECDFQRNFPDPDVDGVREVPRG